MELKAGHDDNPYAMSVKQPVASVNTYLFNGRMT